MKSFFAVALAVVMIALPACAQRGGSRGGFSGHSASGSRGGFAGSAPSRSSGYRGITAGRSPGFAPRPQVSLQRGMAGYPGTRPVYGARPAYGARSPYTGDSRRRRPYVSPYGARGAYFAPGYGAVGLSGPYILDYPDDSGSDDSSATTQSPASDGYDGYDAGPPYPVPPEPPGIYPPAAVSPRPAPEVSSDVGVTLVFKDGRPPVEVHDYVLTRNTLYVWDRHQRVIPTDLLDLAATAKANEDAGVDFQLPEPLR